MEGRVFNAEVGRVRLVVPELEIREACGRYRSTLTDALISLHNAERSVMRLGAPSEVTEFDIDDLVNTYEANLRDQLQDARVVIAPLPDIDLMTLAGKAIDRRRPFDKNGNGFRDSLQWEITLALLSSSSKVFFLISNDRTAFGSDGETKLSRYLVQEVIVMGLRKDSIVLYEDLGAYLKATGTPNVVSYAEVADLLRRESVQIATNLELALSSASIDIRHGQAHVAIEQAFEPFSVDLIDVTVPDERRLSLVTLRGGRLI